MRLTSIQLCNFRQFYGKTPEITLACGQRNTTVIYGNNGAGKTTLLNAFTWVLYEKFSAAFAVEGRLVNKRAINQAQPGEPVECWVEVAFEHSNKLYRIKRLCRGYKGTTVEQSKSELFLYVAGDDGRWLLPQQLPEDIIGRILPESLHQYFFFDGERIDHIARSDKKTEIAEATKELLGVKVLNRSIEHLKNTKKTLEDELRTIGDFETKKLLREQEKLEQELEQLASRQSEIISELEHQEELKRTIGDCLLGMSGAKELQLLRDELEQQVKLLREQLKQSRAILERVTSKKGYIVLLSEVAPQLRALLSTFQRKDHPPTGINKQFVSHLLSEQHCICGTQLIEGSHAFQQVESWLDKASPSGVEERVIRMDIQIGEVEKQVIDFWSEVDSIQNTTNQDRLAVSRVETQLDDINERLRKYPSEDVKQLQKRLDATEEAIRNLIIEQGVNQHKHQIVNTELAAKLKQIHKHKLNEERQFIARRRIAAIADATERIIQVKSRLEQHFRLLLEKRVQEIFSDISFTPYLPRLSDKYELTLAEDTVGEVAVAASTGENQILSLSFIGAIIDRVREWSETRILMGPDSSTFPVVMDSPFGSLDEVYRRKVAKTIPDLANQLIVLVTKTQWRGEVAQELDKYIGKEYVLSYNSPKQDCEEDVITLHGSSYCLVKQSINEFEYTEICDVSSSA